jgi:hypothetical protein
MTLRSAVDTESGLQTDRLHHGDGRRVRGLAKRDERRVRGDLAKSDV